MSIKIEFINLIIPKLVIQKKYSGGLSRLKNECPNNSFREDDDLVRIGFMNYNDLYNFLDKLISDGLIYDEKRTVDFVIINSYSGLSWEVDWLDHDFESCWFIG